MLDDPFRFFRWLLTIFVTVYATIVTVQTLWSYYVWLMTPDRYMTLLRRYVVVQGLRTRTAPFLTDLLICGLLCVALAMMLVAQARLDAIERLLDEVALAR